VTVPPRSLLATINELTGHSTPTDFQLPVTSTLVALVTGTETLPSSVASTDAPLVDTQPPPSTSVLEALVTATEVVVAPTPTETALELATESHPAEPATTLETPTASLPPPVSGSDSIELFIL